MKKILIIVGHPDAESYNFALANSYEKAARSTNNSVDRINICDLDFSPNLEFGYRKRTELEPDLLSAWEKIKESDHIVWIFPVWWGSIPAIMKGFIDRLFLPSFAFKKRENSVWWDKLLTGKSARMIYTMDQPTWYFRFVNKRPVYHAMKGQTCQFVGIQKVRNTPIGPIRLSKDTFREKWLNKMGKLARIDSK